MNIYNLLRLLIKSGAQTGGMSKVQAYDSMALIDELEKVNGFGHILHITLGHHEYVSKISYPTPYSHIDRCGICGQERYPEHE